jgi:hypothetical protein
MGFVIKEIPTMLKKIIQKYNLGIPDYVILSGALINIMVITTIFIFWLKYT